MDGARQGRYHARDATSARDPMSEGAADPHVVVLVPAAAPGVPGAASPVYYRPLARWALAAAAGVPRRSTGVSGPAGEAELAEALKGLHGVRYYGPAAEPRAAAAAALSAQGEGDVLVLDAARVLLGPAALALLAARHAAGVAGVTELCSPAGEPAGAWCFRRGAPDGAASERVLLEDPVDALAVRDEESLAAAEGLLQKRFNDELLRRGVRLVDPRSTRVDPACRLSPGAVVEGGCELVDAGVGAGARVEAGCRLESAELGEGAVLRRGSVVENSRVGRGAAVGPYARLTAGTTVEEGAAVGAYAELEDAVLGRGSRLGGHSFVGRCRVGRNVEIGCGFLTCGSGSEPGRPAVIEDDVFIGAASHVVGAVTIGRGSFVATGTSLTEDAPAESFVISRGRQVVKAGYARRHARREG